MDIPNGLVTILGYTANLISTVRSGARDVVTTLGISDLPICLPILARCNDALDGS